jgi:hypothetical protein
MGMIQLDDITKMLVLRSLAGTLKESEVVLTNKVNPRQGPFFD